MELLKHLILDILMISTMNNTTNTAIKVVDPLWTPEGYDITDSRIHKLLESKTVKRLAWIGQNGPINHKATPNGIISPINRQMHSIGAMILTLKVGGTYDEAIAALLHDIIHTAFSHAFDFVVKSAAVSYHEKHKDRLLDQFSDELKSILGPKWKTFLNEEHWPLIKKNNPFAIDIADYTARDAVAFGLCTELEAREMLKYLTLDKETRQLQTTTQEASTWWTELSQKTNSQMYATPWNYAMNHYLAMALKESIELGKIELHDLELVADSTTEQTALEHALETPSGKSFQNVHDFKWEFFAQDRELDSNWTSLGLFDIRWRIVTPPIQGLMFTESKTKIEKFILACTPQ